MARRWFILISGLALSLTLLGAIFSSTEPAELHGRYLGLVYLLIGLTIGLVTGLFEFGVGQLRRTALRPLRAARRGGLLSLLSVTLLYLSQQQLLGLWNVVPLLFAGLLIELYANSRAIPLAGRRR